MVIASVTPNCKERIGSVEVPVIDLSKKKDKVVTDIVKACEKFGFFKVINHGVAESVINRIEGEMKNFFSLPSQEKQKEGPPNPFGYGTKNIGLMGDTGELEYLLLHANTTKNLHPLNVRCVVNEYVKQVRELACEILEMLAQGLGLKDCEVFSHLLRDSESDSLLRFNHYPPCLDDKNINSHNKVGFGEHTDPQILSILRANDVQGLQIFSNEDDVWIPVPPDPSAFFVNIGDALQAMTNGRVVSVKHRAMANTCNKSRLSMIFFGGPSLQTVISPAEGLVTPQVPRRYKSFTWAQYKKTMYSLRLSHNRLQLFDFNYQ